MREKQRVGILDVFMILLILLGVIGLILRVQIRHDTETLAEERLVAIRASALHPMTASALRPGEILYTEDGTRYGVIEEVELEGARIRLSERGETVVGSWDASEWVDVTLWVRVLGRMGDGYFLRDGTHAVLCGERILLYGERTAILYWIGNCREG